MNPVFEYVSSFDGTKLFLKREILDNAKAVVVISHGAGASMVGEQYLFLDKNIVDAGYSLYIFDHRGHGKSEGNRGCYHSFDELVGDIKTIVDLAKKENPDKKVFLFGNSMGGIGSQIFAIQNPGAVDGIVLSVSATCGKEEKPVKPDNMEAEFAPLLPEAQQGGTKHTLSMQYMMGCSLYYLSQHFKEFSEPVLILSAEKDNYFVTADSLNFFLGCRSPDKMFRAYGDAPHKLFGSKAGPEAMANMLTWLDIRV